MNGAWTIAELDVDLSPIVVPYRWATSGLIECNAYSPDRYCCTRPNGHGGRHAAILRDGQVYAVWPEPEPTA